MHLKIKFTAVNLHKLERRLYRYCRENHEKNIFRIVTPDGRGLANTKVSVGAHIRYSNTEGHYWVPVAPGSYHVMAEKGRKFDNIDIFFPLMSR